MSNRDRLLDLGMLIVVVCAVVVTADIVLDGGMGTSNDSGRNEDRVVEGAHRYMRAGHRIGPEDARVTLVEWGDYQCPACRRFHQSVNAVRSAYREDVAILYRHWPLPSHDRAYAAARAAECAADQGQFGEYHMLLYETSDWLRTADMVGEFARLASRAGVSDLAQFSDCASRGARHPAIEEDIAAVTELGGRGTPTLLLEGVHLGGVPDSTELDGLVTEALRR